MTRMDNCIAQLPRPARDLAVSAKALFSDSFGRQRVGVELLVRTAMRVALAAVGVFALLKGLVATPGMAALVGMMVSFPATALAVGGGLLTLGSQLIVSAMAKGCYPRLLEGGLSFVAGLIAWEMYGDSRFGLAEPLIEGAAEIAGKFWEG